MKSELNHLSDDQLNLHERLYKGKVSEGDGLGTAVRRWELDLLVSMYQQAKPRRSIEWGLGTGISAVALGKARKRLGLPGKHIALDPFQSDYQNLGVSCIEDNEAFDCVDFQPVTSEEFLIQARRQGDQFDFVFIDGAHDVGHKLTDASLTKDVIAPGAIVCFHDSFHTSTSLALAFLIEHCGLELLETGKEVPLKRRLRGIKHAPRLGWHYGLRYAPKIDFALSVLRKTR
jgi:predicted O-methyltransferase YrrM